MLPPEPQQQVPELPQIVADVGSIEWEELPSLADLLAQHHVNDAKLRDRRPRYTLAWDDVLPQGPDSLLRTEPFEETLSGLLQREVHEPDVFQRFFSESSHP
ncbi:MAG: hypothetical protein JHC40_19865 [Burkholderiales bacterium]|nr:hypothetical protein [Burkholderiales bacterium]